MGYRYESEKALELLRIFGRSEIRIRILMALGSSEVKVGQLSEDLNLTTSNILHAMKVLVDIGVIEKTRNGYALTNIGFVLFKIFNDIIGTMATFSKNMEFWLSHDIGGIPNHLEKSIGLLKNCEVIKSTPDDITKSHTNFLNQVSQAKDMKGISPIYCRDFYHLLRTQLKNKINVELLLTEVVLEKVLKEAEEERGILEEANSDGRLRLFTIDEGVNVAFTITDSIISLGFFNHDGAYDMSNDLVGSDEGALDWGMQLYEYYRNQSEEIML